MAKKGFYLGERSYREFERNTERRKAQQRLLGLPPRRGRVPPGGKGGTSTSSVDKTIILIDSDIIGSVEEDPAIYLQDEYENTTMEEPADNPVDKLPLFVYERKLYTFKYFVELVDGEEGFEEGKVKMR